MTDDPAGSPFLLRLVPARFRAELARRRELQNALTNIGWMGMQTAIDAALAMLVGIWVARALGPADYGTLSYMIALVSLFSPIATAGASLTVVRDLVRQPDDAPAILGTATFLRALGSLALIAFSMVGIVALRPDEPSAWALAGIVAVGYAIRNLATFELWFEAKVQGRNTTTSRSAASLVGAALKAALVLGGAGLWLFVIAYSLELALVTVGMFIVYSRTSGSGVTAWRVRADLARRMFSDSWPLIFAGLASFVYMRVDEVLLGELQDEAAVGIYAVGARLSEAFHLLPGYVFASVFPSLVKARAIDRELYLSRFQRVYDVFVWFAIAAGFFIQFAAGPIVALLFGEAYAESATVLSVHVWSGVFWFSGSAGHRYLISENHARISMFMTAAGATVNVLLNVILIPPLGPVGAAYATLVSFGVSHGIAAAVFAPSRITLLFFVRAFYVPGLVRRWTRVFEA